jgi:hypothetical protein
VTAVFVVALAEMAGTVDAEALALAADLGAAPYETRLLLAAGLPAVVRSTPDRALALDLLGRLRGRGHGAVACDASAVVAAADMVPMRRLRLDADAIALDDRPDALLPYEDVLALVSAVHRTRLDATTETRETRFSLGRAVMTGGVAMTKTTRETSHAKAEERQPVLYVFRRSGATPWLLQQHGTSWTGLAGAGRPPAPTEAENYRVALELLRERAPGAVFDDRLTTRKVPETAALASAGATTAVRTSTTQGVDLLAHLVALWIARSAYR